MTEHFRHFCSLAFSTICGDVHYLLVGSHPAMALLGSYIRDPASSSVFLYVDGQNAPQMETAVQHAFRTLPQDAD